MTEDSSSSNSNNTQPKVHVGIIGAGVSGLRCADILLSHGFRVTVLEARDRIGGRLCQSDELGYTVDIGPNWIHASSSGEVHPIYRLAQLSGTPLHKWNSKQRVFDSAGQQLSDETVDKLTTALWDIIGEAFAFSEAEHKRNGGVDIAAADSLYDFILRRAREVLSDEGDQELLMHMSEMWGAYVGEPVWKQSLRFTWLEECCGGEDVFVASNYKAIFDLIARPALEAAEIMQGKRVVSVKTPSIRANGLPQEVRVATAGGEEFAFDEVVMATPLGWLQKNKSAAFDPPLPERLSAAIGHLRLSYLEKVFITFPRAFWIADTAADAIPSYTTWLSPSYATKSNPRNWPQETWNLAAFEQPNSHPTILFYTYGDASHHIVDSVYGKTKDEQYAFLTTFFRPYFSRLAGFDASSPDCVPRAVLATAWQKDDLNGNASYCNFQVGVEAADQDILAIRSGCPERRLWFCGEHAAPFDECGTVAGAYLSGQSAAEKILEANGLGSA